MEIANLIREYFNLPPDTWADWVPADHIGRQDWQIAVEAYVSAIRTLSDRSAFGLSETEISVQYHQPLGRFAQLIGARLGIAVHPRQPGGASGNHS